MKNLESTPSVTHDKTEAKIVVANSSEKAKEREMNFWTRAYFFAGGVTLMAGLYMSGLWLVGLVPMALILEKIGTITDERKQEALARLTDKIKAHFPDAKITPEVPIGDAPRPLEMFVELPEKRFFLISVRVPGKGKVFYNEQSELICFQREGKSGVTRYKKPDLIEQAKENEYWIRKNRRDLFGGSSRDARRTAVRILVFAHPTQMRSVSEQLYDNVGSLKVPYIRNSKGTIYLLLEEQVCDFLANKPF